jgi:hypothetical protein
VYLAAALGVPEDELPAPGCWSECGQTIGALALRLGVLTLEQIDAVIDYQSHEKMRFGEIAIELGFTTAEEIRKLLQLQAFHRGLELCELLVLSGRVDVPRMCELMAGFLRAR